MLFACVKILKENFKLLLNLIHRFGRLWGMANKASALLMALFSLCLGACGKKMVEGGTRAFTGINPSEDLVALVDATLEECPAGGTALVLFRDLDDDGLFGEGDVVQSRKAVCSGLAGVNGADGDDGQDGVDGADGLAGADGMNGNDGVDGQNGSDGADAEFSMGAVGPATGVAGLSACHHDYLYISDAAAPERGWLLFRHQKNGSADQGIGSTGFQVWNVDIANFALASEVGGVTYCTLSYDAQARRLSYTVVDNAHGLAGTIGEIEL
jgi:hypothetical protein